MLSVLYCDMLTAEMCFKQDKNNCELLNSVVYKYRRAVNIISEYRAWTTPRKAET